MTAQPSEDGTDRLVDRIGKLLAQAEGTDNEHEAAAFVERAQQLATAYAVDLELARSRQRERSQRGSEEPLVQERVEVGPRGKRGNRHRVLLYSVIARANDVLVNVAHDSTYVLGFGHRADLEVVERLWASLAVQMTVHAQRRMDHGEHRAAGVAGQSWRLSFYDGWVQAIGERLQAARERAVALVTEERAAGGAAEPSAALVLRAKAVRVQDFYAGASEARGSWRGPWSGRTQVSGRAVEAGRTDGARADLGQPGVKQRGRLGA
ncbi:MAG: DUF2786 domain-containing protein [Frankiales bacterium]|nr:DUF2786 domain-containing protein [Frankiales bacterium]